MAPGPWRGGRINAVPDCPPYHGFLPDRYCDYDVNGLNVQTATRREKAGAGAKVRSLHYRRVLL